MVTVPKVLIGVHYMTYAVLHILPRCLLPYYWNGARSYNFCKALVLIAVRLWNDKGDVQILLY